MSRCTTTSGPYRCKKDAGHKDDCEADDQSALTITLGPYRDSLRTRAYVRGAIDFGAGGMLDTVGSYLHVKRERGEDDCAYRVRLSGALG